MQALALVLLLGALVYLFYPAIVAAREGALTTSSIFGIRPQTIQTTNDTGATAVSSTMPLLTLVIPAYDEEERLPSMLQEAYSYLNQPKCKALHDLQKLQERKRPALNNNSVAAAEPKSESESESNCINNKRRCVEWIVVDDGSRDKTCRVYENCIQRITTTPNTATMTTTTTTTTSW